MKDLIEEMLSWKELDGCENKETVHHCSKEFAEKYIDAITHITKSDKDLLKKNKIKRYTVTTTDSEEENSSTVKVFWLE